MGIKLGSRVKDTVTGLSGIVIGRTEWLTGCASVGLQPAELKDGKAVESSWFDENRIIVLEESSFKPQNHNAATAADGGPHDSPTRSVSPGRS